jgi:lipoprotein-releasing system ATP-binding protein
MMENNTILEVKDLHKFYREGNAKLEVLTGVNMSLKQGEIACIMGESGSGKTTLLNLLGSLDFPDKGCINYKGTDITRLNRKDMTAFRNRHIGFLFQFHYLLSDFTALENVIMPGLIAGKAQAGLEEKAGRFFEKVGLEARAAHFPAELSGGEQQRVAMIRAIINDPVVILADEPAGNLDEKNSARLMELIFDIGKELNQTLLIATHSSRLAKKCQRIFYLEHGKVSRKHEV